MSYTEEQSLSGAELFSAGRFSEALNEYDVDNPAYQEGSRGVSVSPSQAVYAACNRAAAKLELEMCRSCLRDCDEAIRLDPSCLRAYVVKGQAFHRLGKISKAREAYEAGVAAGKVGGDVLLFVELVTSLKQLSEGTQGASAVDSSPAAHLVSISGNGSSKGIGSKPGEGCASGEVLMGTMGLLSATTRGDNGNVLHDSSLRVGSDDPSLNSGIFPDSTNITSTLSPMPLPEPGVAARTLELVCPESAAGIEEGSPRKDANGEAEEPTLDGSADAIGEGNAVADVTTELSAMMVKAQEWDQVEPKEGIMQMEALKSEKSSKYGEDEDQLDLLGKAKDKEMMKAEHGVESGSAAGEISDAAPAGQGQGNDGDVEGEGEGEEEGEAEAEAEGEGEGEGEVSAEEDGVGVDLDDSEKGGAGGAAGAPSKKKKKKKKSKSKRNKGGKITWCGEEDESGQRLTLRANKDGGGVTVEGLSEVLAASDISPVLLEAARGQLCHAVGDPDVDNLIALGYLQVNTGNYRKAVELFCGLLSIRPGLVGAHLGLGSALALLGGMENAVASFSAAIEVDPLEPDCWKRRGQTRAAMGHAAGALSDLDRAVELFNGRDADVIHQRGMVYHKLRYFNRAVKDFTEVTRSIVDSKVDWNMIGLCRGQLGEPEAAEEAYRRALAIDSSFKEAWTNLGSMLKDWGKGPDALAVFDRAITIDSTYVYAYYVRGLCKHGMGDHKGAQVDFMRGLFYDNQDEHCLYMAALCMHARGQLDEAARCYDALLSLKPGHQAWYTRECCVYLWNNIRRPWREFSSDAELDPEFKEGWCKRHDPMTLKRYTRHRKPTGAAAKVSVSDVQLAIDNRTGTGSAEGAKSLSAFDLLLEAARPVGPGIQLTSYGFLKNRRQHAMYGLAALEVGQLARRHWESLRSGGMSALVPDAGSSAWRSASAAEQDYRWGSDTYGGAMGHPVGYRDVFDVAVRWRQVSEPNDPVWWIDRLTPEAFKEGFGLQTPMVNGQLKVVRYYPYYNMAFDLMRRLMLEQSPIDNKKKEIIMAPSAGLVELHEAVGHDHWVVTPCERASLKPGTDGRIMEGTRLTIVASPPEGFEFTIRTPGTPERWNQYDGELSAVWEKLTAAVCESAALNEAQRDSEADDKEREAREDAVCDLILEVFYYWVNFGPLSRGSAACGYVMLAGLMAAAGWRLAEPVPRGVQMDWEAILRPTPKAFVTMARPWLHRSRRRQNILQDVPLVADTLPTALDAIKALNCF